MSDDHDTGGEDLTDIPAWRAWAAKQHPELIAAYHQWRTDHGLGEDADPSSQTAMGFVHGALWAGAQP